MKVDTFGTLSHPLPAAARSSSIIKGKKELFSSDPRTNF